MILTSKVRRKRSRGKSKRLPLKAISYWVLKRRAGGGGEEKVLERGKEEGEAKARRWQGSLLQSKQEAEAKGEGEGPRKQKSLQLRVSSILSLSHSLRVASLLRLNHPLPNVKT